MPRLKDFLGKKSDSKEAPFESYDTAVANARRAAQVRVGEKALTLDKIKAQLQMDQDPSRPVKTVDNPLLGEIAKANPELAQELEMVRYGQDANAMVDRNAINAELVKEILKQTNPEIIANVKYSPKTPTGMFDTDFANENQETQLRIYEGMKPLLEKATDTQERRDLEKYLKSQGKFIETKSPKIIPSDLKLDKKGTTLKSKKAVGARESDTGQILLNEDLINKEQYSIVPHEILHGLTPSRGSEDTPDLSNIQRNKLREALVMGQQGHIDTIGIIDAPEGEIAPAGESAVYWKIMKDLINKNENK